MGERARKNRLISFTPSSQLRVRTRHPRVTGAALVAPGNRGVAKRARSAVSRADSARKRAYTVSLGKIGAKDSSPGLPASSLSAVLVWPNPA